MKRFFSFVILGFVVVTAISYFGLQWRLKTALEESFQSMEPFVDASFETLKIDLNGKISVNNVNFFVPMANLNVTIDSIGIATSSIWETLALNNNLEKGKLPNTLKFDIRNFNLELTEAIVKSLGSNSTDQNIFTELMALGCGRASSLGPLEYYNMGVRSITLDSVFGYDYDESTDELVSLIDVSIDGLLAVNQEQVTIGAYGFLENFNELISNPNFTGISTKNITVELADLGYNEKLRSYCANASGVTKVEWVALNKKMFTAAMTQINLQASFDYTEVYELVTKPRSKLRLSFVPLPGFSLNEISFYSVSDLIELVDFKVTLNEDVIPFEGISWNQEKLDKLNLSSIRRAYQVNSADEGSDSSEAKGSNSRVLQKVPVSDLDKYVNRTVYLERNDGTKFIGIMTSVTWDKVSIRARLNNGYADLRVTRGEIKTAKLYPVDQ